MDKVGLRLHQRGLDGRYLDISHINPDGTRTRFIDYDTERAIKKIPLGAPYTSVVTDNLESALLFLDLIGVPEREKKSILRSYSKISTPNKRKIRAEQRQFNQPTDSEKKDSDVQPDKPVLSPGVLLRRSGYKTIKVDVGIIVVSDTGRGEGGDVAESILNENGFNVVEKTTIPSSKFGLTLVQYQSDPRFRCILTLGGTGVSKTDIVVDTCQKFFDKELNGFGELFRYLTYEQYKDMKEDIGLISVATRTTAGVKDDKVIYALPGAPSAIVLGMKEIVIYSIKDIIGQLDKEVE